MTVTRTASAATDEVVHAPDHHDLLPASELVLHLVVARNPHAPIVRAAGAAGAAGHWASRSLAKVVAVTWSASWTSRYYNGWPHAVC